MTNQDLAMIMAHVRVEMIRGKSASQLAGRMVVLSGYRGYAIRGVSVGYVDGICLGYSNLNFQSHKGRLSLYPFN